MRGITVRRRFEVRILAGEHFGKLSASQAFYMDAKEPWYVYLLLCDQKTFYVGITPDIVDRFRQHRDKTSFFTKKFSDIQLVYCEQYSDKHTTAKREKQLKGWSHAKKQMLINGKLGYNTCTELVEALLRRENLL
jgi:putative endonuclease